MEQWLVRYGVALQERTRSGELGFAVGDSRSEVLLHLAKIVADGTGDRRNAPLSCYLAGRFAELRAGEGVNTAQALSEAVEIATAVLGSQD